MRTARNPRERRFRQDTCDGEREELGSGGAGYDGCAEVVEGVSGGARREGFEEDSGGFGTPADLAASLIDAAVVTQQIQYFTQRIVVVQVAVEQLEQPGVGSVG
jgi:hypothetical protein